ncbi:MAG: hypothetical protein ABI232_07065 [Jatrophihabitantaceae bacterium]
MSLAAKLRRAPERIATGAFILNSGLGKLKADEQTAVALHGMAAGAYPVLAKVPPKPFLKGLAVVETSLGAALLLPIVPARVAGAGLVAFSGGLLTMWWRTPGMHDGLRPTHEGTAIAKDSWMFGIGTSLLIDSIVTDTGQSHVTRKANRKARKSERKAAKIEAKFGAATRHAELRTQTKAVAKEHALAARASAKEHAAAARKVARKQAKIQTKNARAAAQSAASTVRSAAESAVDSASSSIHALSDTIGA